MTGRLNGRVALVSGGATGCGSAAARLFTAEGAAVGILDINREADAALAAQQGRMCEPEEVARAALFLLSDEVSFVNGTQLYVDNGFSAM